MQLAIYCLSHVRLPKSPIHYTFTLKMTTTVFAETLDQHSSRLTIESRSYKLNSTRENLRTRIFKVIGQRAMKCADMFQTWRKLEYVQNFNVKPQGKRLLAPWVGRCIEMNFTC